MNVRRGLEKIASESLLAGSLLFFLVGGCGSRPPRSVIKQIKKEITMCIYTDNLPWDEQAVFDEEGHRYLYKVGGIVSLNEEKGKVTRDIYIRDGREWHYIAKVDLIKKEVRLLKK